ncbi:DUF1513 domain-containing protein [Thiofilum flexile]|uniref:DUF1513 domain-containing protein n=1 Tax=Thiofilum flexile TaxID=125627 RepID=UPI000382697E|nr:DUF1513 domain-containing protein [Thiofilum flexile]
MHAKRRHLLQLLGGAGLITGLGAWGWHHSAAAATQAGYVYSAATLEGGVFALVQVELASFTQRIFPLPFQGHGILPLSAQEVLVSGRRPGTQCAFVNTQTQETRLFNAQEGRHFNGHACLSADRQTLFTTENAYDEVRGIIGIRDAKTGRSLGEYWSGGLDPHDIKLMPDGRTLVIANGGIETHPDFGRRKLNIETMQPSLVYLDSNTGKVLTDYRLPQHQLSIRHLNVTPQGDVGIALQYEGNSARTPPIALVAWQAFNQTLKPILSTPEQLAPFRGYLGDLIIKPNTQELMATSLLGQHIGIWDVSQQSFKSSLPLAEPNGIALTANQQVLVSSATGSLNICSNNQTLPYPISQTLSWDNHLVLIS